MISPRKGAPYIARIAGARGPVIGIHDARLADVVGRRVFLFETSGLPASRRGETIRRAIDNGIFAHLFPSAGARSSPSRHQNQVLLGFGLLIALDKFNHLVLPLWCIQLVCNLIEHVVQRIERVDDLPDIFFLKAENSLVIGIEEFNPFSVVVIIHVDAIDVVRFVENVSIPQRLGRIANRLAAEESIDLEQHNRHIYSGFLQIFTPVPHAMEEYLVEPVQIELALSVFRLAVSLHPLVGHGIGNGMVHRRHRSAAGAPYHPVAKIIETVLLQKFDILVPIQDAFIVSDELFVVRVVLQVHENLMPAEIDRPAGPIGKPPRIVRMHAQYALYQ